MNIILGGTHGLGADIAAELRAHGEETFVVGSSYEESTHGQGMKVDLLNMDEVEKLRVYMSSLGRNALDGFYWVAGYGYHTDFAEQGDVQHMVDVNFRNPMPIVQKAWQRMIVQTIESHFVVISSTTGITHRTNEAVYASTKFAQVGFARSLGLENERLGTPVKVALFEPGGMKSPFWDRHRPVGYEDYMETADVARFIVDKVSNQEASFYEKLIRQNVLDGEE